MIAYLLIIFLIILNYLFYLKRIPNNSINILNVAITIQIILGIITLITGVKIEYASIHQLGSVFVLLLSFYLL